MGSEKFRLKIILRILILLALGFGAVFIWTSTNFWLISLWLILFFIIGVIELIGFLEKSKKELGEFLLSIRQKDFSGSYPEKDLKGSDYPLHHAFNVISSEFQKVRRQRESNHLYLQTIVEHTGIALICYNESNQEIQLMNKAAKNLFKKPYLKKIQGLEQVDKELPKVLLSLKSGEKILHKIIHNGDILNLSIHATEIKLEDNRLKLVSFQDIKMELEQQEIESWQKLIRVLTHEIMNSAIPISTLTSIINQKLGENKRSFKEVSSEDEEDIKGGLKTIENRSKGLISFVESYKTLTKLPKPEMEVIKVKELLERVVTLMQPTFEKDKFLLKVDSENDIEIKADPKMIEQVLINLLKNALEAVNESKNPKVAVSAVKNNNKTLIRVKDNGSGIDRDDMESIFIPFFTTKKQGTGIGLSLSRQIMRLHKGRIMVQSTKGEGTTFTLEF